MVRPPLNPRLVLFLLVAGVTAALLWSTRAAMGPFALGLVLAYLLAPLVGRLQRAMPERLRRRTFARPLAILLVYVAAVAALAAVGAAVLPAVLHEAQDLLRQAPTLAENVVAQVRELVDRYYEAAPPSVREMVDRALDSSAVDRLTSGAIDAARRMVMGAFGAVSGTVGWLLGMLVVPIWLVYILNDTQRALNGALGLVPRDIRPDVEAVRVICDRVLSAYIRGQLVVAVLLGLMVTLAMTLLGVPYPLLLGFVAGLLGFIPFLGSILGALPAVMVAASQSLRLALLVVLAFVVVQQIDNLFISPRMQARAVALSPALIMVVLVIGQAALGPVGMVVAVPLTAALRDVVHYLYLRVGDDRPSALDALATVGYGAHATDAVRAAGGPAQPAV